MSNANWATAALTIAVLMLAVGPALSSAHTTGASAAPTVVPATSRLAVHPSATDSIMTTDRYGYITTSFDTGLSTGDVYFYATDPSDTTAQVTITDPNATRDGVPAPAASWTVTFHTSTVNSSYSWNAYYQIPLTLAVGGWWNISISGANGGVAWSLFQVHTYSVGVTTDASVYLPGHTATLTYAIYSDVNDSLVPYARTVQAVGFYEDRSAAQQSIFPTGTVDLLAEEIGNLTLVTPTNIMPNTEVFVEVWANVTGTSAPYSEMGTASLRVGSLAPTQVCLGSAPSSSPCVTSPFEEGSLAVLSVDQMVQYGGEEIPAVGLHVTFNFQVNGTTVSAVPGNPPLAETTNSSGSAIIIFLAELSSFPSTAIDRIVVNVSDPNDTATGSTVNVVFQVLPTSPGSPLAVLALDRSQYYSGDTVTATWSIGGTNSTAAQGWVASLWALYSGGSGGLLAVSAITSTSSTGSFQYHIPLSFQGSLDAQLLIHNATEYRYYYAEAIVSQPQILLTPSELTYQPGDSVTIGISTEGSVFQGSSLYGNVIGEGLTLFSGAITGSSISFTIPKVAPPSEVSIFVAAQSPTLGVIAANDVTLDQLLGWSLTVNIASSSNYADGSFQPGQTISLHYALTAYGNEPLPEQFRIFIYSVGSGYDLYAGPGSEVFDTVSSSGTVSYTIPSGLGSGSQLFEVYAETPLCSEEDTCSAETLLSLPLNSNPSPLAYEIGAGSGITVSWLILLALILVVLFFVWRGFRNRRRPMMMAPITPAPAPSGPYTGGGSPSAPSPPPPSGATAPSWQEQTGGSPPAGSTPPGSPPLPSPPQQP
jgi:hypothetical protein